mmetsp:Transcript_9230/g.30826  ORF Transcript_9230/g.30826 Transcript_9230/m.30826 type:complete len:94 (+) Transcript_9230:29-310(+)
MFQLLVFYGNDSSASMYATQMHSDSGYMVTGKNGATSYGGYLTWDDHPANIAAARAPRAAVHHRAKPAAKKPSALLSLHGCQPFGCISTYGDE